MSDNRNLRDARSILFAYARLGTVLWLGMSAPLLVMPLIGPDEQLRSPFSVMPDLLQAGLNFVFIVPLAGMILGLITASLLLAGGMLRNRGYELLGSIVGFVVPYLPPFCAALMEMYAISPPYAPTGWLLIYALILGSLFPRFLIRGAAPIWRGRQGY